MSKIGKTMVTLGVVAGLGVACLPLSSYAAELDATDKIKDLDVVLSVRDSIILELKGGDNFTDSTEAANAKLDLGELGVNSPSEMSTGVISALVTTTHATGYSLKLEAKDSTAMTKDGSSATIKTLQANDTPFAAGMKDSAGDLVSRWAYKVGSTEDWSAIPAKGNPDTIGSSKGAVADEETEITFGAVVAPGQEVGTYKGTVTLTATVNGDVTD